MAWSLYGPQREQAPLGIDADVALAGGEQRVYNAAARVGVLGELRGSRGSLAQSRQQGNLAYNTATGEWAIQGEDGQLRLVDKSAANLVELAKTADQLPLISEIPQGWRPVTAEQYRQIIDAIPQDSDFWGEAKSAFKSAVGLGVSAVDAMIGDDDPSNAWSRATEDYQNQQTIGQFKASDAPWMSSRAAFTSGLGYTAGNLAGAAAIGAPLAATGVGAPIGFGVAGAALAAGDQATGFYSAAMEEMAGLPEQELAAQSPLYADLRASGYEHEEAMRTVAIEGARVAMGPAAALGGLEGIIGGALGRNVLSKLGLGRTVGGAAGVTKPKVGLGRRVGGALGRATAYGVGSGAQEVAETAFSQSAGAAATGIGDTDPWAHASLKEFEKASQAGFILGALGGGRRGDIAAQRQPGVETGETVSTGMEDLSAAMGAAQVPEGARALGTPAFLRRGTTVGPGGQGQLGLDIPAGFDATNAPPAATPVQQPMPEAGMDPAQQDLLNPPPAAPGPDPAQQEAAQALQMFAELGVDVSSLETLQAALPQLLDMARQAPWIEQGLGALQRAGVLPHTPQPTLQDDRDYAGYTERDNAWQSWLQQPASLNEDVRPRVGNNLQTPQQLPTPEPLAAPTERTPDGRPTGVAPPPLANPEPMDPEQARQAAVTQAERRQAAGVAPAPGVPAGPPLAAPVTEEGVTPSTPEPTEDIVAQVEAMLDPQTERDAVFVAAGNDAVLNDDFLRSLPPDVTVINRKQGTLLTVNAEKADLFRKVGGRKLTDAVLAQLLGYSESKTADNVGGVVVEARTPGGAVAAQQLAKDTPANKRAAAAAVAKQARKDAEVVETTPERAQAERAARATATPPLPRNKRASDAAQRTATRKSVSAPATATERKLGPKTKAALDAKKKPAISVGLVAATTEPAGKATRQRKEDLDDTTRTDRATQTVTVTGEGPSPTPVEIPATERREAKVRVGKDREAKTLPAEVLTRSGLKGTAVDLRVISVDPDARADLMYTATKKMTPTDRALVEQRLSDMKQAEVILDAAVLEAEDKLVARVRQSAEGPSLLDETQRRIELREAQRAEVREAMQGEKEGRAPTPPKPKKAGRPAGSYLTELPLLVEEMLHFARKVRREAQAEVGANTTPADSVVRHLLPDLFPRLHGQLGDERLLQAVRRAVAEMTDAQLDQQVRAVADSLQDAYMAKRAMRGATQVARVQAREVADVVSGVKRKPPNQTEAAVEPTHVYEPQTAEQLGLKEHTQRHTRSFVGDLPNRVIKLVNAWGDMLERGKTKMDQLLVLSKQTAQAMYPEQFASMGQGRYGQVITDGKVQHVIAIDFESLGDEFGIEIAAHEFGEYAARVIFNRSDQATQDAVNASYEAWLATHALLPPGAMFKSHAPELLKTLANDDMSIAYTSKFSEWLSNHIARWMLTDAKPRGPVETFFAKAAEVLKKIWQSVIGTNAPDPAVAAMMDAWVAGRQAKAAAGTHRIESTWGDMDVGDVAEPTRSAAAAAAATRRATAGVESTKRVYEGFQEGGVQGLREALVGEGGSAFTRFMETKLGRRVRQVSHWITNMDQLVAVYADTPVGPALSEWVRLHRRAGALANRVLNGGKLGDLEFAGVAQPIEAARNLAKDVRQTLEKLMLDSTRYRIQPDQTFESQKWLHEGLREDAVAENRRRYLQVAAEWEALRLRDAKAIDIYNKLRDAFQDLKDKEYTQLEANIRALNLPEKIEQHALARLEEGKTNIRNGPYFPLMREGDWIISATLPVKHFDVANRTEANRLVRDLRAQNPGAQVEINVDEEDGSTRVSMRRRAVRFFESQAEAEAARVQMLQELATEYKLEGVDIEEVARAIDGDNTTLDTLVTHAHSKVDGYKSLGHNDTQFIAEFREQLRTAGKMDEQMAAAFEQAFIEALPELSPRKALLKRENILGASPDMLKSYTQRFFGAAHAYAHTVYNPDIRKQWNKMLEATTGRGDTAWAPAGDLVSTLRKHLELEQKQREMTGFNAAQNGLLQLTTLSFLAFAPAYLLMNAMQPMMVTIPVLSGSRNAKGDAIGYTTAAGYIKEAYAGAPMFFSKRGMQDFITNLQQLKGKEIQHDAHALTEEMLDTFSKTSNEKAMLQEMLELGRLDFSFLDVLQDVMQGGKALRGLSKLTRLGMSFAQQGEAMNRVVTALAAYRIAINETKMSHEQAVMHASDVVGESQIDYSTFNRPPLLKFPGARVVLQFKMFLQGMYGIAIKNLYLSVAGKTKQDRVAARKVMQAMLGTHLAVAGVNGIGPAASVAKVAIAMVAGLMGRDDEDDEWKDADTIFNEQTEYIFGATGGELARSGLPTLFGGDISNRVEFPNLFETKYMGIHKDSSGDEILNKWIIWAGGAPLANLGRVAKAIGNATDENPETTPEVGLPAGARGIVQAVMLAYQGLVDKDGDVFLDPGEVRTVDAVMKAIGISPTRVDRAYAQRSAERGTIANIRATRNLLVQRMRNAEDREEANEVREEIREFNDKVPTHFRITGATIGRSTKAKRKRESGQKDRDQKAVQELLQ